MEEITRLSLGPPARKIRPSSRSLTGRVSFKKGISVPFESSLERDLLILMDFDPAVIHVHAQPLVIGDGRYYPDFLIEYESSRPLLCEVKYRQDLRENWKDLRPKFKLALKRCKEEGWRFRIFTELEIRDSHYLRNATFLRPYRSRTPDPSTDLLLLQTLKGLGETTPQGLLAAAYWTVEHRMQALAHLWRLVAERRIGANLMAPLTMGSSIWSQLEGV